MQQQSNLEKSNKESSKSTLTHTPIVRTATAIWSGPLREGEGELSTESEALYRNPYSFSTRFEKENGTNPEELIAAAHASCFSMALTGQLEKHKLFSESLEVHAVVVLEKNSTSWSIPEVKLQIFATVPNCSPALFDDIVKITHENCPVSKLLNVQVKLETHLKPSNKESFHPGPV